MRAQRTVTFLTLAGLLALVGGAVARERHPRMPRPQRGTQIVVGPILVPAGEEVTECTYMKLPSRRDMAVNRVKIRVWGGSHHIHLYQPYDHTLDLPAYHETCNSALDFDVWQLVLASQSTRLHWKLPPGVAFHFRGREQLVAQTHFVDNGLLATPEPGWAIMNLYALPENKVTSYAGAFFGQDRDVVVPAHSTATATTRCVFPKPVKLLGMTGHYHFRGTRFTAGSWDGTTGRQFYVSKGYTDPLFERYGERDAPEVPGLEWTCTYENDTDSTYTFGPFTDRNEHCNLFAFYYPAEGTNEFLTCVQKDGVTTVTVHN
jgi:hypothetical protein